MDKDEHADSAVVRPLRLTLYVSKAERDAMERAAKGGGYTGISRWAEVNLPLVAEIEGHHIKGY